MRIDLLATFILAYFSFVHLLTGPIPKTRTTVSDYALSPTAIPVVVTCVCVVTYPRTNPNGQHQNGCLGIFWGWGGGGGCGCAIGS